MKVRGLICFFLLSPLLTIAQEKEQDTLKHSVKKAVFFSTVLPGAGQVYNHLAMPKGRKKAYWKIPLIYAGLGSTGFMVLRNNQLQKELKQEYNNRAAGLPGLAEYEIYDDQGILTLYNFHLSQRDLFILGFGVVYFIQIVDAAVEAHFVEFDISEDLSLKFSPAMLGMNQPGLKVSLNFVK